MLLKIHSFRIHSETSEDEKKSSKVKKKKKKEDKALEKRKKKERKEKKKEMKNLRLKKQQSQSDKEGKETAGEADTDNTAMNDSQEENIESGKDPRSESPHDERGVEQGISPTPPVQHQHSSPTNSATREKAQAELDEEQGFDLYGDIGDSIEYPDDPLQKECDNGEWAEGEDLGRVNSPELHRSDSILDIHATLDFEEDPEAESPVKKDVFAPMPELSKWERDDEVTTADRGSGDESPNDEKAGKVTNEVLKRAENALFSKAIQAIRPIEIRKISIDRQRLYTNENDGDATLPEHDVILIASPPRPDFQITVPVHSENVERSVEIRQKHSKSREKSATKTVRSIKDRLGKKIDDEPRGRTCTPPRKLEHATQRNRQSHSRGRSSRSKERRQASRGREKQRDERDPRKTDKRGERADRADRVDRTDRGDNSRRTAETKRSTSDKISAAERDRNDRPQDARDRRGPEREDRTRELDKARELARARERERQQLLQRRAEPETSSNKTHDRRRDRSSSTNNDNRDRDNEKRVRKESGRSDVIRHRDVGSNGGSRSSKETKRIVINEDHFVPDYEEHLEADPNDRAKVSTKRDRSPSASDDNSSSSSSDSNSSDSGSGSENKRRKKRKNKKQKKSKSRASSSESDDSASKRKKRKNKKSKKKKKTKK